MYSKPRKYDGKYNRRAIITIVLIALFCALTSWIWTAEPSDLNDLGSSSTQLETQSDDTPVNGYRANGKCYVVIGQGGFSQQVDCSTFHKLPKPVRKVVGSTAAGCMLAWVYAAPIGASCTAALIGTIPFDN